jgi:hypothetical protein
MVFKTVFYKVAKHLLAKNTIVLSNTMVLSRNSKKYFASKHTLNLFLQHRTETPSDLILYFKLYRKTAKTIHKKRGRG